MIARMWHGKVLTAKAEAYHEFLKISGLADYENTAGNEGVFLLKNEKDGVTHFYTFTLWKDLESIKKFAGENYEEARYYPGDREFLLEFEPQVTHFDVLEKPAGL
jgi:heme-degrading monooxygenase HmoA